MKLSQLTRVLVLGLALAMAGSACKTRSKQTTPLPDGGGGATGEKTIGDAGKIADGSVGGGGESKMGGGDAATFDPDSMNQDRSALASQTIYFDYDSSTIKSSDQSKLAAVADALRGDGSAKLLVEGHCDERGTEEYNRSLGERRALASREALVALGVDAARIATRSYGEDRPADPGHDQAAWAKNRCDDFVLLHAR